MKFFIATVFYLFTLNAYSIEVVLICKGESNFYSSVVGSRKNNESIEVRFDDIKNKLLYISPSKLFGCYEKNDDYINTCDCKVDDSTIMCLSRSQTKNGAFSSSQTIRVNRYSGVLNFSEITNMDGKEGKSMLAISGELKCESFASRRF